MFDMLRIYQPTVTETCICQFYIYQVYRIALQVGRKIAPCDRALIHVCLAYLFLHSGQVLSSFKCYFKRKYLNLIDSNCDVDESVLPVVFYRDCSCMPQALNVLSIYMWYWGGEISLRWVQFDRIASRDLLRWFGGSDFGNGRVVLCTWETVIASSGLQLLWEGYVFLEGFLCTSCII